MPHEIHDHRSFVFRPVFATSVIMLMCGFIAACGDTPEEKSVSQVVASVNDKDITIHEVNYRLQQLGGPIVGSDEKTLAAQRRAVTETLVTQRVLADKAVVDKVDRDPKILLALAHAREAILANAYVERMTNHLQPPTDLQVKTFFDQHPELFTRRKIYRGEQLVIKQGPTAAVINTRLKNAKSPVEVVAWLKAQNPRLEASAFTEPAEKLSMEALPTLAKMATGETRALETANGVLVIHLIAIKDAPVTLEQTKSWISSYLLNQEKKALADKTLADLKTLAQVKIFDPAPDKVTQPDASAVKPRPAPATALHTGQVGI